MSAIAQSRCESAAASRLQWLMVIAILLLLAQAPTGARPQSAAPPAGPAATVLLNSLFPQEAAPADGVLGVPVYPNAVFLTSYDAGRGQRYYLYGATGSFVELVAYYRTLLKNKGTQIFDQPLTHIFEIGRYNEATMAFPPSVTIKDYASSGAAGYLNPKPGAQPERFATIIQIVPAPR
jgi:hypothetical protein